MVNPRGQLAVGFGIVVGSRTAKRNHPMGENPIDETTGALISTSKPKVIGEVGTIT